MSVTNILQHGMSPAAGTQDAAVAQQARLEIAAEQFEAMFLRQILKQMRKASDVLSEGSSMRSRQMDTLSELYDEALADNLASQRKTGVTEVLVKQLSRGDVAAADGPVHHVLPPAAPAPRRADSLLAPIIDTWQQGVDSLASTAKGLKALVERVIKHESAGQVAAVSNKGARGLMQLMPDTAREMADELGLEYSERRLTTDADYNKRLGSAYLNKMLKRYDGAVALAVAAYNAGPGRIDQWLKSIGDPRQGGLSVEQWVERIPFKETRQYTRSILADLEAAPGSPVSSIPLPTVSAVQGAALKGLPERVAFTTGPVTSTVSSTADLRSAAFAPNLRLVRQEIES
ncbi:transglycosylase SLT domain-containing protein [Pseudomonas tussilaginis]|uniref:lytic transglycosylase domain-containing protein n=1 Tax=Pseudomonas alkylphenolica TaxID=237609 RepID=UPI003F508366